MKNNVIISSVNCATITVYLEVEKHALVFVLFFSFFLRRKSGVELCFTGTLKWAWSPHSLHPDFLRRVFCRMEHTWSKWDFKEREVALSELSEALKEKGEEQWLTPSSFFLLCVFIVKVVAFNLPSGRIQIGSPMAQSLRKFREWQAGRLHNTWGLWRRARAFQHKAAFLSCAPRMWAEPAGSGDLLSHDGHQARLDCFWDFPNQMTNP